MPALTPSTVVPHPRTASSILADRARNANGSFGKRAVAVFTGYGEVRARYSIAKLLDFDDYRRNKSSWRIAAVLVLTPLPAVILALVPVFIPLKDPTLGVFSHAGFPFHFLITLGLITFGNNLMIRGCTGISLEKYRFRDAIAGATIGTIHLLGYEFLVGYLWRFPVPFTWAFIVSPWMVFLVWGNALVFWFRFRDRQQVRELLRPFFKYIPVLIAHSSQVVIYPSFSAIFEIANEWQRVSLTLLFPVIKYFLKKITRRFSRHLNDYAEEVAVVGAEISGSMYQAMIMQTTPSLLATIIVIGVDVVQGFISVRFFMDKRSVIPQVDLIDSALLVATGCGKNLQDAELSLYSSRKGVKQNVLDNKQTNRVLGPVMGARADRTSETRVNNNEKVILTHALEILLAAETILLVEYIEVMVPLANTCFLLVATRVDSAQFNPKLAPFYGNDDRLTSAIKSLMIYTSLQCLSVVARPR